MIIFDSNNFEGFKRAIELVIKICRLHGADVLAYWRLAYNLTTLAALSSHHSICCLPLLFSHKLSHFLLLEFVWQELRHTDMFQR